MFDPAETGVTTASQTAATGYRACNTRYHDVDHTTAITLAMIRLIHGAVAAGERFEAHDIRVAFAGVEEAEIPELFATLARAAREL